jgi:hypothetical protein
MNITIQGMLFVGAERSSSVSARAIRRPHVVLSQGLWQQNRESWLLVEYLPTGRSKCWSLLFCGPARSRDCLNFTNRAGARSATTSLISTVETWTEMAPISSPQTVGQTDGGTPTAPSMSPTQAPDRLPAVTRRPHVPSCGSSPRPDPLIVLGFHAFSSPRLAKLPAAPYSLQQGGTWRSKRTETSLNRLQKTHRRLMR